MKNRLSRLVFTGAFAAMTAALLTHDALAGGNTIHVPADYATIQAAIDAANSGGGDEIIVAPGTYNETINFNGKPVHLRSSGGPAATIIDGTGLGGSVVLCIDGEGPDTILEGFTITGGTGRLTCDPIFGGACFLVGGGMANFGTSPTVIDCIFDGNSADFGGGMCSAGFDGGVNGSPTIINCIFQNNIAAINGGGMGNGPWVEEGHPTVIGTVFKNNTAGFNGGGVGIGNSPTDSITVIDCLFEGNTAGHTGGAMFNATSRLIVTNCTFLGNTSTSQAAVHGGGAISTFAAAELVLNDSDFTGNSALQSGGAVFIVTDSAATFTNCTFSDNSSSFAGAMYVSIASSATVNSCSFSGNFTVSTGGDNAGGAFIANAESSVDFIDSTFIGNSSATVGGGVGFNNAQADFDNCHFIGNTAASSGGGAYLNNFATISFADCLFDDNSSFNGGGAVLTGSSQAQFLNCEFSGNSALQAGGGVNVGNSSSATFINGLVSGNDAVFGGGIFATNNGTAEITNCTIAMNVASSTGGGIRLGINGGSAQVRNSVLWSNFPEQITTAGSAGPLTVTYSNIQGGGFAGTGNINADPLFVDPANGDFRLAAGSPSIDAGDNFAVPAGITTDLDGNPRFVDDPDTPDSGNGAPGDAIVDMGAYEFQVPSVPLCPGDLTGNGSVGVADLLALLACWGPVEPGCESADLTGNNNVGVADLLDLLSQWGPCPR